MLRVLLFSCFAINLFAASDSDKKQVQLPADNFGFACYKPGQYSSSGVLDLASGIVINSVLSSKQTKCRCAVPKYCSDCQEIEASHRCGAYCPSSKKYKPGWGAKCNKSLLSADEAKDMLHAAHAACYEKNNLMSLKNALQNDKNEQESFKAYLTKIMVNLFGKLSSDTEIDAATLKQQLQIVGLLNVLVPSKKGFTAYGLQVGFGDNEPFAPSLNMAEDKTFCRGLHSDVHYSSLFVDLPKNSMLTKIPLQAVSEKKASSTKAASGMLGVKENNQLSLGVVTVIDVKALEKFAKKHQVSPKVDHNQSQKRFPLSPENEQK